MLTLTRKEPERRERRRRLSPGRRPDPHSPGQRRWALKSKAPPHSPLPPATKDTWNLWPLSHGPEPRAPLAPAPSTSTHSTHIFPSPAAAGTSTGRRFSAASPHQGFPPLTSFPVWAGGVGQWQSGRSCLSKRSRPGPALPAFGHANFRPKEGGAMRKAGDRTGVKERLRLGPGIIQG